MLGLSMDEVMKIPVGQVRCAWEGSEMQEIPPPENETLATLLRAMAASDDALMAEMDPTQLIGSVKDKVDAINTVLRRLEFQAAWNRQCAEPFLKKAISFERNYERLEEYVLYWMQAEKFDQLPGNEFKVRLKNNPPSMPPIDAPDALTFRDFPQYVEQVRFYRWKNDVIKKELMAKREAAKAEAALTFMDESLPFAKLTIKQKVVFEPNTPDTIPAKTRKKKDKKDESASEASASQP